MDEPTCYTVLYEFMPDFIDYLKEAPFENELTMTKDVKTELNNSLDSMLGEQATFWEMWDTTEGTDDVVEIFGGLQNDDDMIVELYSPPRVVEAARARGLRASLSIDLVTGYDLRLAADKDRVREEIRKRKPRLLVTSPPCTKFSTMQHLRTNWDNWEEEIAEATDHVDFSMEMLGEQLDRGAHGLHEHPRTAKSWDLPSVRNYVNNDQVILVKGDQCRFGLKELRMWTRYDLDAKRYRCSNSKGPLWGDVVKRITLDLEQNRITQEKDITPNMTVHQLHEKLPEGVRSIETILVYRRLPDHPDPGIPFEPPPDPGTASSSSKHQEKKNKPPEEDARMVDRHLKRTLDEPVPNDRAPNRSRVFGTWQANRLTEWGDKKNYPVIAGVRDIRAVPYIEKNDCYFNLMTFEDDIPLSYLTKQSGKELNEKKLTEAEKRLFDEAKKTEIGNLVGSNAIELVIDEGEVQAARDKFSHRIMPSRFLLVKKQGEVGENWKAKARWILLGHKDPDSLQLERFAPTPSTTTVMLCLQIIASHHYHLYIMDVSSAFGQSDPCEREQGPLWASMPPTGIPEVPPWALIRVRTAVYGLVNAPAVWRKTVRRLLLSLEYIESVLDPCLYYLPANEEERNNGVKFQVAGIVLLDVDDFCQGGNSRHEALMSTLRTKLKFGKWKDVYGSSAEYIGRTLSQQDNFEIRVSMKRYIQEKLKPVVLPKERLKQKDALLDEKEVTWLRGVGGSLLWVGKEGRPDVGAACAMAMSWSSSGPTVDHILMANKTVNELKQTMEVYLRIIPIPTDQGIWLSVADASMANVEQKSQGGFLVALVHHTILNGARADFSINSWRSHKLKRVVKATLGSEALAMDDALAEIEWVRAMWHEAKAACAQLIGVQARRAEDALGRVHSPKGFRRGPLDLRRHFKKYGHIEEVSIQRPRDGDEYGVYRYGFIRFESKRSYDMALRLREDELTLNGQLLRVRKGVQKSLQSYGNHNHQGGTYQANQRGQSWRDDWRNNKPRDRWDRYEQRGQRSWDQSNSWQKDSHRSSHYWDGGSDFKRAKASHGQDSRKIWVGNLPPKVQEDDLQRAFRQFGHIEFTNVVEREDGRAILTRISPEL
eukprot:g17477.t1